MCIRDRHSSVRRRKLPAGLCRWFHFSAEWENRFQRRRLRRSAKAAWAGQKLNGTGRVIHAAFRRKKTRHGNAGDANHRRDRTGHRSLHRLPSAFTARGGSAMPRDHLKYHRSGNRLYLSLIHILLSGTVVYQYEGKAVSAVRKDCFHDDATCLHVCRNTPVTLVFEEDGEVLVQQKENPRIFPAVLYDKSNICLLYTSIHSLMQFSCVCFSFSSF